MLSSASVSMANEPVRNQATNFTIKISIAAKTRIF
jgi:hypothetical protein